VKPLFDVLIVGIPNLKQYAENLN